MTQPLPSVLPALPEETLDPVALEARLKELRRQLDQTKRELISTTDRSEAEIAELRASHSARQISIIEESIAIIAKLRGKASGPAKAGGKRAKKAPIDMSHLFAD